MKLNKKTLMPTIVLVSICVVVAALLGAVNMLTAPVIEKNALKKEQEALFEVFEDEEEGFDRIDGVELPKTVSSIYKAKGGKGYVVSLATSTDYSAGDMTVVVGIDNDGKIVGIKLTGYYESKDFGKSYPENFVGKNEGDYDSVEKVSGVTYSSTAFKAALGDAFTAVEKVKAGAPTAFTARSLSQAAETEEVLPKTDEQIKAIFEEMAKGTLTLTDITPKDSGAVKRIYKDEGGKGYFAYVVTTTKYGPETEGAVYINLDGEIAAIKLLSWNVGHGVDYTKEYIDSFNGKDNWKKDGVILVSEATRTAENFRDAVFSAVKIATYDMPRSEKKILEFATVAVPNDEGFERVELSENAPKSLKALYKEKSGKGFVAYIVTSTQYVAVETEAVVYFDAVGTVRGIELLNWTVGHGVDYTEAFLNSFIGKSRKKLDSIELVTNATGTSEHLCDAVMAAIDEAEVQAPVWRIVAIVITLLSVGAFTAVLVYNRKRRAPYEK